MPSINSEPSKAAGRQCPKFDFRWIKSDDMPRIREIEQACFEYPWTEQQMLQILRKRDVIGMLAEHEQQIVGFFIYLLGKSHLEILNLAVDPYCQRRGVGTAMVNKLKDKLCLQRRNKIKLSVRETNLDAQLFFKSQGFIATSLLHNLYDYYTDEDGIAFRFVQQSE